VERRHPDRVASAERTSPWGDASRRGAGRLCLCPCADGVRGGRAIAPSRRSCLRACAEAREERAAGCGCEAVARKGGGWPLYRSCPACRPDEARSAVRLPCTDRVQALAGPAASRQCLLARASRAASWRAERCRDLCGESEHDMRQKALPVATIGRASVCRAPSRVLRFEHVPKQEGRRAASEGNCGGWPLYRSCPACHKE
jgi:hypothetical protein